MLNNKKSKIVDNKILTKVIDRIQCKLMDLGDVTYDIKRLPSSTPDSEGFIDKILDYFFSEPKEEQLSILLYDRNNCQRCVWTSVDMNAVLKATSKDGAFADQELIDPMVRRLRLAFEALK